MKNPRVRAVLFDWDGTLSPIGEPPYPPKEGSLPNYGPPFDPKNKRGNNPPNRNTPIG